MLKVGIFGDSYADPIRHGHDNFRELDAIGWPNLLKNNYEVGLHALAGSSIYYSYQEFLKHLQALPRKSETIKPSSCYGF